MHRTILAVFAAMLLIVVGCTKQPVIIIPANITGQWQWTSTLFDLPLGPTNPSTPLNGGTVWSLTFYNDNTWSKRIIGILSDTGTYSLGHGTITSSGTTYNYDSVAYFHSNTLSPFNVDYYKMYNNDSLVFSTSFIGAVGSDIVSFSK
jgi:hypothetical protein